MTIRTVLGHAATHTNDNLGGLLFLDQEKAYDRLSHQYLEQVLYHFGFPASLVHALLVTTRPTIAHVLDVHHPLEGFHVHCGVRQGDPLAPLLFNLAFEPFLAACRKRLQGIRLPWGHFRVGAYADDLIVALALLDVLTFQTLLTEYC